MVVLLRTGFETPQVPSNLPRVNSRRESPRDFRNSLCHRLYEELRQLCLSTASSINTKYSGSARSTLRNFTAKNSASSSVNVKGAVN